MIHEGRREKGNRRTEAGDRRQERRRTGGLRMGVKVGRLMGDAVTF